MAVTVEVADGGGRGPELRPGAVPGQFVQGGAALAGVDHGSAAALADAPDADGADEDVAEAVGVDVTHRGDRGAEAGLVVRAMKNADLLRHGRRLRSRRKECREQNARKKRGKDERQGFPPQGTTVYG